MKLLIISVISTILTLQLANADPANELFTKIEALDGTEFSGNGEITTGRNFPAQMELYVTIEGAKYGFPAVIQGRRQMMKKIEKCPNRSSFRSKEVDSKALCYATFKAEYQINDLMSAAGLGMGPYVSLVIWDVTFPNM